VIERLVGMQAQWRSAPYVGIWTRTTSFRREALERKLASAAVVKATVMRQTRKEQYPWRRDW
jgi:winged helix DNA-binding protein